MRIPVRWLQELTGIELAAAETAKLLSAKGISVEETVRVADAFEGAVVGEVVEVQPHRLTLFDGRDVVELEADTAFAVPDLKVAFISGAKRLLRESDIGLENTPGYVVLPVTAEVGSAAREWIDDDVLIVELPPSRGDLTGIIGIAREFACFAGQEFRPPAVDIAEDVEQIGECLRLKVDDARDTPDYIARLVRGIRVAPSPFWLKWRLHACGIRPISNVVDVTNYVMFKYGQPLHGFDAGKLQGNMLTTRRAKKGETIVTIDGIDRPLDERVLVIADEVRPVAIAGVMGGQATEITDATRDVVIECARFTPAVVRHGSRAVGLATEASQRFELGIDTGLMEDASREAAMLMKDIGAGRIVAGKAEVRSVAPSRKIQVSWERTRRLLGMTLEPDLMSGVLKRLGFELREKPDGAEVTVPSFRFDVEGAVDLAEEIGRVVGYDGIPSRARYTTAQPGRVHSRTLQAARVREALIAAGFNEAQTLSFLHQDIGRVFRGDDLVVLQKPMNERFAALRPSLLPNLLEALSLNLRRGFSDVRLFELGTVFAWSEPNADGKRDPKEQARIAGVVCGNREPVFWAARPETLDLYDIKGSIESVLQGLGFDNLGFAGPAGTGFDARCATGVLAGNEALGSLGWLASELATRYDISAPVFAFDLDLEVILRLAAETRVFEFLPRLPSVARDYAFTTATSVSAAQVLAVARRVAGALVEELEVFDRFQGKPLPENRQSIGIRLTLRAADRTLTAADVDDVTSRLKAAMRQELGAELRA
jgi:phenylalanyl-tRNA synthetase beta chain